MAPQNYFLLVPTRIFLGIGYSWIFLLKNSSFSCWHLVINYFCCILGSPLEFCSPGTSESFTYGANSDILWDWGFPDIPPWLLLFELTYWGLLSLSIFVGNYIFPFGVLLCFSFLGKLIPLIKHIQQQRDAMLSHSYQKPKNYKKTPLDTYKYVKQVN